MNTKFFPPPQTLGFQKYNQKKKKITRVRTTVLELSKNLLAAMFF